MYVLYRKCLWCSQALVQFFLLYYYILLDFYLFIKLPYFHGEINVFNDRGEKCQSTLWPSVPGTSAVQTAVMFLWHLYKKLAFTGQRKFSQFFHVKGRNFPDIFYPFTSTYHPYEPWKISCNSVRTFLRNAEDRHTDRQTDAATLYIYIDDVGMILFFFTEVRTDGFASKWRNWSESYYYCYCCCCCCSCGFSWWLVMMMTMIQSEYSQGARVYTVKAR